jgi:single-strand selective monofunctional uracil DNA glycosylase
MSINHGVLQAAEQLSQQVSVLKFSPPTHTVYNPLSYAWRAHRAYIERYVRGSVKVVFLGMNPGPWGMAQVGVPFGEISAVQEWIGICEPVDRPVPEHPKRPIEGFDCRRSEVSGRRLWGLFRDRFGSAEDFFRDHFVLNYCPLVFMESSGKNRTPDKLPPAEREPLFAACDEHLRRVVELLSPDWVIGVGKFASKQAENALSSIPVKIDWILHPSPASPAANRDWAGLARTKLLELGVWQAGS